MTRTLLVVDDDANVRQLVRRVVSKDFDATLLEADHGLAAIDVLMDSPVDLVLLDISMPIMSGLETLDALRRIPQFARLPVMILAAKADATQVQQLLGLGITGFLVKPFRPSMLRDRLDAVLTQVPSRPALPPRPRVGGLDLDARSTALLLDHDPEFRSLFMRQMSPLCHVEATGSVAQAIEQCAATPLDAVFVGALHTGVQAELFARKARLATQEQGTPIIGLARVGERAATEALGLYEFTILRSFMPPVLQAGLSEVMTPQTVARWILAPTAPAALAFGAAAVDQLAHSLAADVALADDQPAWAAVQGRWVDTQTEVQAHGLSWRLSLELPYTSALRLAEEELGHPSDQLTDTHLARGAGQVTTRLATTLASQLERELDLKWTEPTAEINIRSATATAPSDSGRRWWLTWNGGSEGAGITLAPLVRGPHH